MAQVCTQIHLLPFYPAVWCTIICVQAIKDGSMASATSAQRMWLVHSELHNRTAAKIQEMMMRWSEIEVTGNANAHRLPTPVDPDPNAPCTLSHVSPAVASAAFPHVPSPCSPSLLCTFNPMIMSFMILNPAQGDRVPCLRSKGCTLHIVELETLTWGQPAVPHGHVL